MDTFKGKIVLITGASAGIGKALALEFAKQGANLVLTARRLERLEALSEEVRRLGVKALPIACDVNEDGDLEKAVAKANEEFGPIDVVVANAGFGVAGKVEGLTLNDFRRQFETNVFGLIRTVYAALEDVTKTKGRIVLIGSVNGYMSLPAGAPYGMSKFAVKAFAQSLYHELKPKGVAVTLISPGFVESEIRQVNNEGVFKESAKDPAPKWLQMPAEKAARQIVRAACKRRYEAIITGHGKIIAWLARHFPWFVNWMIGRIKIPDTSLTEDPKTKQGKHH